MLAYRYWGPRIDSLPRLNFFSVHTFPSVSTTPTLDVGLFFSLISFLSCSYILSIPSSFLVQHISSSFPLLLLLNLMPAVQCKQIVFSTELLSSQLDPRNWFSKSAVDVEKQEKTVSNKRLVWPRHLVAENETFEPEVSQNCLDVVEFSGNFFVSD